MNTFPNICRGKTVEMVSLVLDTIRKCDARPEGMGGTLIVVPSSVLDQWFVFCSN